MTPAETKAKIGEIIDALEGIRSDKWRDLQLARTRQANAEQNGEPTTAYADVVNRLTEQLALLNASTANLYDFDDLMEEEQ